MTLNEFLGRIGAWLKLGRKTRMTRKRRWHGKKVVIDMDALERKIARYRSGMCHPFRHTMAHMAKELGYSSTQGWKNRLGNLRKSARSGSLRGSDHEYHWTKVYENELEALCRVFEVEAVVLIASLENDE